MRPPRTLAGVVFYGVAILVLAGALAVLVQLLRNFERDVEANLQVLQRVFSDENVLKPPGDPALRFATVEELAAKYENVRTGSQGYFDSITVTKFFGDEERTVYPFYQAALRRVTGDTGALFLGRPVPGGNAEGVRVLDLATRRGQPMGRLYVRMNGDALRPVRQAIAFLSALLVGAVALLAFQFRRQEQVITRTTVELDEKRRELVRLERLALAGQLSANIFHDLKKPVLNIKNEIEELDDPSRGVPGAPGRIREHVGTFFSILREINLERLVRAEGDREFVDLNETVERSLALVRYERGGVELVTRLAPGLPPVLAVPVRLVQVFSNLALNAYQALGGSGRLTVTTRGGADRLTVDFEDNGPGIAAELQDRVFAPFFTTKPSDSGTGLGLYITHDIVRDLGGEIRVESVPGRTVFRVELPVGAA